MSSLNNDEFILSLQIQAKKALKQTQKRRKERDKQDELDNLSTSSMFKQSNTLTSNYNTELRSSDMLQNQTKLTKARRNSTTSVTEKLLSNKIKTSRNGVLDKLNNSPFLSALNIYTDDSMKPNYSTNTNNTMTLPSPTTLTSPSSSLQLKSPPTSETLRGIKDHATHVLGDRYDNNVYTKYKAILSEHTKNPDAIKPTLDWTYNGLKHKYRDLTYRTRNYDQYIKRKNESIKLASEQQVYIHVPIHEQHPLIYTYTNMLNYLNKFSQYHTRLKLNNIHYTVDDRSMTDLNDTYRTQHEREMIYERDQYKQHSIIAQIQQNTTITTQNLTNIQLLNTIQDAYNSHVHTKIKPKPENYSGHPSKSVIILTGVMFVCSNSIPTCDICQPYMLPLEKSTSIPAEEANTMYIDHNRNSNNNNSTNSYTTTTTAGDVSSTDLSAPNTTINMSNNTWNEEICYIDITRINSTTSKGHNSDRCTWQLTITRGYDLYTRHYYSSETDVLLSVSNTYTTNSNSNSNTHTISTSPINNDTYTYTSDNNNNNTNTNNSTNTSKIHKNSIANSNTYNRHDITYVYTIIYNYITHQKSCIHYEQVQNPNIHYNIHIYQQILLRAMPVFECPISPNHRLYNNTSTYNSISVSVESGLNPDFQLSIFLVPIFHTATTATTTTTSSSSSSSTGAGQSQGSTSSTEDGHNYDLFHLPYTLNIVGIYHSTDIESARILSHISSNSINNINSSIYNVFTYSIHEIRAILQDHSLPLYNIAWWHSQNYDRKGSELWGMFIDNLRWEEVVEYKGQNYDQPVVSSQLVLYNKKLTKSTGTSTSNRTISNDIQHFIHSAETLLSTLQVDIHTLDLHLPSPTATCIWYTSPPAASTDGKISSSNPDLSLPNLSLVLSEALPYVNQVPGAFVTGTIGMKDLCDPLAIYDKSQLSAHIIHKSTTELSHVQLTYTIDAPVINPIIILRDYIPYIPAYSPSEPVSACIPLTYPVPKAIYIEMQKSNIRDRLTSTIITYNNISILNEDISITRKYPHNNNHFTSTYSDYISPYSPEFSIFGFRQVAKVEIPPINRFVTPIKFGISIDGVLPSSVVVNKRSVWRNIVPFTDSINRYVCICV